MVGGLHIRLSGAKWLFRKQYVTWYCRVWGYLWLIRFCIFGDLLNPHWLLPANNWVSLESRNRLRPLILVSTNVWVVEFHLSHHLDEVCDSLSLIGYLEQNHLLRFIVNWNDNVLNTHMVDKNPTRWRKMMSCVIGFFQQNPCGYRGTWRTAVEELEVTEATSCQHLIKRATETVLRKQLSVLVTFPPRYEDNSLCIKLRVGAFVFAPP